MTLRKAWFGFGLLLISLLCLSYIAISSYEQELSYEHSIHARDSIDSYAKHIEDILLINFTNLDSIQAHGFAHVIYESCDRFHVDWSLVASIIYYESTYQTSSVNPKSGCVGLMALCDETAARQAKKCGVKRPLYRDPFINILLGTCYLRELLDKYPNNLDQVINVYVGNKTETEEAVKYRGGVKADYLRMKRMR